MVFFIFSVAWTSIFAAIILSMMIRSATVISVGEEISSRANLLSLLDSIRYEKSEFWSGFSV